MTNTPTVELKACAHCRGQPFRHEADFEIVAAIAIGCGKCGALGPFIDVEGEKPTEADWRKAEAGWNTRALDPVNERLVEHAYREGHCDGRVFVRSGEFSTEEIDWQKSAALRSITAETRGA